MAARLPTRRVRRCLSFKLGVGTKFAMRLLFARRDIYFKTDQSRRGSHWPFLTVVKNTWLEAWWLEGEKANGAPLPMLNPWKDSAALVNDALVRSAGVFLRMETN